MAIWALVTFLLGVLALLLYIFNVTGWFMAFWPVVLMVLAFGMLMRISRKEKEGEKEKLVERIQELEAELRRSEKPDS